MSPKQASSLKRVKVVTILILINALCFFSENCGLHYISVYDFLFASLDKVAL